LDIFKKIEYLFKIINLIINNMLNFYKLFFIGYATIISKNIISDGYNRENRKKLIKRVVNILSENYPFLIIQNQQMREEYFNDNLDLLDD
tara:strand:+ start:542 stop:811 length:270 start_codon:yes stop_codon:yes gene_type:complete